MIAKYMSRDGERSKTTDLDGVRFLFLFFIIFIFLFSTSRHSNLQLSALNNCISTTPACHVSRNKNTIPLERTLYASSSVQIYQVPPLKSLAQSHRAAGWDVSNPIWEGSLRVLEIKDLTTGALTGQLRLFDMQSGELFAAAPYTKDGKGIEPVSDSGRYFAVRVVNGTQSVCLGLVSRTEAEALKSILHLQDFRNTCPQAMRRWPGSCKTPTNSRSKEGQKFILTLRALGAAQEANAEKI